MTRQHIRILTVLLGAGLLGSGWPLAPVQAAGVVESAYTPLVLDKCGNVTPPDMEERGAVFRCEGYGGIAVRVAEGDLRMFVSYGDRAEDQTAASQTLPAFNATGETLEWRLEDGKPFARILRYHRDSDGLSRRSTLVITKSAKRMAATALSPTEWSRLTIDKSGFFDQRQANAILRRFVPLKSSAPSAIGLPPSLR